MGYEDDVFRADEPITTNKLLKNELLVNNFWKNICARKWFEMALY